jgi:ADP-ribose pyrophosphatase
MKIIEKRDIANTKFLNLVQTEYEDKKGRTGFWVSAERPNNQNAVVIVAIVPELKRLVVISEFRVPLQGYEWGLPAGLIDEGRDIEETARRELKEETGLEVVRFIRPPSPLVYNSPGLTNEAVSYAFVEATGELTNSYSHDDEDITPYLLDASRINELLHSTSVMIGAKAWLIFERFVKYGDI